MFDESFVICHSPDRDQKMATVKTEASVIHFAGSGMSVVGYHRSPVACASIKAAIVALLSMYIVCNINYDSRHKLVMNFVELVLSGKHVLLAKTAAHLIIQLKL